MPNNAIRTPINVRESEETIGLIHFLMKQAGRLIDQGPSMAMNYLDVIKPRDWVWKS